MTENTVTSELKKSVLAGVWFMILTFPLAVVRVNTFDHTVEWRWMNMAWVGGGAFVLSFVWRWALRRREAGGFLVPGAAGGTFEVLSGKPIRMKMVLLAVLAAMLVIPWVASIYWTNTLTALLLYVVLGLGLNIIVGVAGLLFLGHAAFYAIGAYSYALLNQYFGLGFWTALPLGGLFAALAGVLLAFPVLRLRGDYLAIVTLGFGEIIRLVLENWSEVTGGPTGISNIPQPALLDMTLSVAQANIYIYHIVLALAVLTVIAVSRLKDSRVGRALQALREDEIACQAMGIDRVAVKLMAFGLGTAWAGLAGVIFAAKTTFINPASFTFFESAILLSVVVLGGMGSNLGVILGAAFLVLLPEFMRTFSEYRMILFAAAMVLMMVFRPQGLIPPRRRRYPVGDSGAAAAGGGK